MIRTTTTAALSLVLFAGAPALADGHGHGDKQDSKVVYDGMTADELRAELPSFEKPELWFGSKAPEMTIAEWVKGEPVTGFEPGKAYVVEFWATWCGPCIRAFPHLSELQAEYGDKVGIVGVNIWERVSGEERTTLVRDFVEDQGDKMAYTVALEDGTSMAENWMKAAGRNGIPSAFIVDGEGNIAWMGHPMEMDEPLAQVVAGDYDHTKAGKEAAKTQEIQARVNFTFEMIATGDAEKGYALARTMLDHELAEDEWMLNQVAWVTAKNPQIETKDLEFSLAAAKKACEMTDYEQPMILHTLAHVYFEMGKTDKAIETCEKALGFAGDDQKAHDYIAQSLEQFKS